MNREILIDGCSIIIENVKQNNSESYINDSSGFTKILSWTKEQIIEATKPAVTILKSLRDSTQEMASDEMELSMQFGLELNGETPIFKVVSVGSTAQISVKCVWKKEQN